MPLNLKPHEYSKQEGSSSYRLTKVTPYIRVGSEGESLFLQEGKVFSLDGKQMKDVPDWCKAEIEKLTPAARAEVGFPAATVSKVN